MFCKYFFFFLFNFIIFDFPRSTRYGWTERKGKKNKTKWNEKNKNKTKKMWKKKKKIWKEKQIPSAVADSQITLPRGFEYTRMCKSEWCNYLWSLIRHSLKSTGPPTIGGSTYGQMSLGTQGFVKFFFDYLFFQLVLSCVYFGLTVELESHEKVTFLSHS